MAIKQELCSCALKFFIGDFQCGTGEIAELCAAVSSVTKAQLISCAFKSIWRSPDEKLCCTEDRMLLLLVIIIINIIIGEKKDKARVVSSSVLASII